MSGLTSTVGVVVSVNHRQQSIVSGGSDGGIVTTLPDGRVIGMQRPMHITTDIVSQDIVWVKTESGKEIEFRVNGDTFSCREGHRVAFVYDNHTIWIARNFTTDRTMRYIDASNIRAAFAPEPRKIGGLLCIAGLFGIAGAIGTDTAIKERYSAGLLCLIDLFFLIPIFIFYLLFKQGQRFKKERSIADSQANQFIQEITALENGLSA